MGWIKDALLDIVVTIVLVLATFGDVEWARWAITVYTPFILLLKAASYAGRYSLSKFKPKAASAPDTVFHVLYGMNVLIASYDQWWWVAGCWALIWIISAALADAEKKKKKKK